MRIEIKAQSSLFSMGSPGNFNEYFKELCIDKAKDRQQQVAAAFKAVKSNIYNMDGGAGNPPAKDNEDYVTSYVWKNVLQKDSLLDILQKFIHLQVKKENSSQAVT